MIKISSSTEEELSKYLLRRSNDIYLFSNVFSEDMCNKLVEFTNKNVKNRLVVGEGQNVQAYEGEIFSDDPFFKPISSKLIDIGRFLACKYHITFGNYNEYNHEGITIRKIYGPTQLHTDGPTYDMVNGNMMVSVDQIRSVSVIIALNGDYDGGEIVFPCQNFKTKLKQGEAIAFPPHWTHPHYTEDLKNNTFRYTINTWLTL
tara:strand:- start:41 stop:649 length:609 start_codon:yes stop_codon:yes gene_type:complete